MKRERKKEKNEEKIEAKESQLHKEI